MKNIKKIMFIIISVLTLGLLPIMFYGSKKFGFKKVLVRLLVIVFITVFWMFAGAKKYGVIYESFMWNQPPLTYATEDEYAESTNTTLDKGSYKVGDEIPAGKYHIFSPNNDKCRNYTDQEKTNRVRFNGMPSMTKEKLSFGDECSILFYNLVDGKEFEVSHDGVFFSKPGKLLKAGKEESFEKYDYDVIKTAEYVEKTNICNIEGIKVDCAKFPSLEKFARLDGVTRDMRLEEVKIFAGKETCYKDDVEIECFRLNNYDLLKEKIYGN